MSYAVQSDLVARFGELEIIQLSDDGNTGEINTGIVSQALSDVDAVIDSYLTDRYVLPLTSIPAAIVPIACDIAHYRLATRNGGSRATDTVKDRNDEAIKWLQNVAAGKVGLGITGAGTELPSFQQTRSTDPDRNFSRDRLRDYNPLRGTRRRFLE